jgi:Holliday junction resolvase RusA-like endonuclease
VFHTSFTVSGTPLGKPRQTQADRWQQRDCVVRYRAWADEIRLAATGSITEKVRADVLGLYVFAHFELPASWSEQKKQEHYGRLHRTKPDSDNIVKAVADSLLGEDKTVPLMQCVKCWCEENVPSHTDIFLLIA